MRFLARPIWLLVALFMATSLPPAGAQTNQQTDWCFDKGDPSPDLQIGGCTAMIQSGKSTGKNLAIEFNNRCSAYIRKGDIDSAIKDCDQAIKLNAGYSLAYYNRGLSYYDKDNYD